MFKFFKKIHRKENFKLIASCSQMARRLQGLHTMNKTFYADDEESLQLFEYLIEFIEELNKAESYLDFNVDEVLPIEKSNEFLQLHGVLTVKVKEMESGMKAGKDWAKRQFE